MQGNTLMLADVRRHIRDQALASEALVTLLQLDQQGRIHIYRDTGWGMLHGRSRRLFAIYDTAKGVRVSLKWWLSEWLKERTSGGEGAE